MAQRRFDAIGKAIRTRMKQIKKPNKAFMCESGTRVVTDIDDTVRSSGGVSLFGIYLGGVDQQLKRGSHYPGAFQFAFELSQPSICESICTRARVAVLTARARELRFALELRYSSDLCTAYRIIGSQNGCDDWGIGDVYYGSIQEWAIQSRKSWRKFINFDKVFEKDKQFSMVKDYILLGDTGEKDEEAGEFIADKYGNNVIKAIFLHEVVDNKLPNVIIRHDRTHNNVPIIHFKTYVGAAVKAYQHGLISADGLKNVTNQAQADLSELALEASMSQSLSISSTSSSSAAPSRSLRLAVGGASARLGHRVRAQLRRVQLRYERWTTNKDSRYAAMWLRARVQLTAAKSKRQASYSRMLKVLTSASPMGDTTQSQSTRGGRKWGAQLVQRLLLQYRQMKNPSDVRSMHVGPGAGMLSASMTRQLEIDTEIANNILLKTTLQFISK